MPDFRTFETGARTYVRAQQAWQILTAYVQFGLNREGFGEGVITYGKLGHLMGFDGQTAGRQAIKPVRHIYRFCVANDLPLLSVMVVRKDTGLPGWDYMVPDEKALQKIRLKVREQNWFEFRTPTASVFKSYPLSEEDD